MLVRKENQSLKYTKKKSHYYNCNIHKITLFFSIPIFYLY
tara:strand:+ start:1268 stop:1387 length:120 start_codon:yes stop_codon:yes gene_type:complete